MITPCQMVFADSRARLVCVISSLHMHLSSMRRALFKGSEGVFARAARVQGQWPWCLRGMSEAKRPELSGGSAVGGTPPYKYSYRESAANGADPLNAHARERMQRAHRRARPGTVIYLILTVPIDTILIINKLQIIYKKIWCQIVLF